MVKTIEYDNTRDLESDITTSDNVISDFTRTENSDGSGKIVIEFSKYKASHWA